MGVQRPQGFTIVVIFVVLQAEKQPVPFQRGYSGGLEPDGSESVGICAIAQ